MLRSLISATDSDIIKYIESLNPTITDGDNYWFFEGTKMDVIFVAHIDTARKVPVVNTFQDSNMNIFATTPDGRRTVLGADDRAGVVACINLMAQNCSVLFTNYEESGGRGVKRLIRDNAIDFSETKLFIELDRRGSMEFVTYNELPDEIRDTLKKKFALREGLGSYSDIADLTDAYGVPSINLAIGYHNEHTDGEYLNVDEYSIMLYMAGLLAKHNWPMLRVEVHPQYDYEYYDDSDYDYSSVDNLIDDYLSEDTAEFIEDVKLRLIDSDEFFRLIDRIANELSVDRMMEESNEWEV